MNLNPSFQICRLIILWYRTDGTDYIYIGSDYSMAVVGGGYGSGEFIYEYT